MQTDARRVHETKFKNYATAFFRCQKLQQKMKKQNWHRRLRLLGKLILGKHSMKKVSNS